MQLYQAAFSLPVADPRRTHTFYTRVFGGDRVHLDDNTVSVDLPGASVFFIEREEFNLLLKPALVEADFATEKFTSMLSATVGTRDEAYACLKAAVDAGGSACGQAVHYPWGMASYFKDPDGHLWEIIWRDGKFRE
ncbi:MAG: VOC family protein [Spirochaetes bacterium]|nr:VOC family protein [Spirochaetota bacterium]